MFGMRYAIDVVFLDGDLRVVRHRPRARTLALSPRVGAPSVLELPAGTLARTSLVAGARVVVAGDACADRASRGDGLRAALTNAALATLFAFFASAHVTAAVKTPGTGLPSCRLVAQETLLVGLFLARRRSTAVSSRPFDWAIAMAGTFLALLLRPSDAPSALAPMGEVLQCIGVAAAALGLASLGRSFGLVAANRGVKTSGAYRLVRHPAYGGYLIGYAGYVLCYPTPANVLLLAGTLAAMAARAIAEERFLARDASYREYLGLTPWRFVPYVY